MTDRIKVLILTADAGFGHRSAANAIAAALQARYAGSCEVSIVNPLEHPSVPAIVRRSQFDYDRLVRVAPRLYKLGYQASDKGVSSTMIDTALAVVLFIAMRDLIRRHKPDVMVTTYPLYQSALSAVFTLQRRAIPLLTVVTDRGEVHRLWFHEAATYCLVPGEEQLQQATRYGFKRDRVRVTGIPVNPALGEPPADRSALRAQLGWLPDEVAILFVGSKRVMGIEATMRAFDHSGHPIQLVAIAGGELTLFDRLEAVGWHHATHIYNFVEDMPRLMHAADIIASKAGGLIVTESLACGKPMLLLDALPGQEVGNADFVVQNGAGEVVRTPVAALEALYHWLESDGALLAERTTSARRLGKPRAAFAVAEMVFQAARQEAPAPRDGPSRRERLRKALIRVGIPLEEASNPENESGG